MSKALLFLATALLLTITIPRCQSAAPGADDEASLSAIQRHANWVIDFYQRRISPVDGGRCGMRPTCSEYGRHAMRRLGFWRGLTFLADRLMRDNGSEDAERPSIRTEAGWRTLDPLEANLPPRLSEQKPADDLPEWPKPFAPAASAEAKPR